MIRFNNDYNRNAHPEILKALQDTAAEAYGGYGIDEWCDAAKEAIHEYLDCPEAAIHFLVGGTQANYLAIEAMLDRPYYSVIAADSGHICVHESGAIEHTGHKIHQLKAEAGKITASQIEEEARYYADNALVEHITHPRAVYISQPTEFGTCYSLEELKAISDVCDRYDMYLYIDGARLGYGLAASDATLADVAELSDMFYIGGTKCGFLMGEALVITNPALDFGIRNFMKLNGALLAKGWLLGLQYHVMFKDGLYFEITEKAVRLAMRIKDAFNAAGIKCFLDSPTNQQFFLMTKEQQEKLAEEFVFEYIDPFNDEYDIIRFCTSWSTTEEEVEKLCEAVHMGI